MITLPVFKASSQERSKVIVGRADPLLQEAMSSVKPLGLACRCRN